MNKEVIHAYRGAALDLIHTIPPLYVSNKARYGVSCFFFKDPLPVHTFNQS